jgi:hypothetical protein
MWPVQPESPAAIAVGGGHGARMAAAARNCSVGAMGRMICGGTSCAEELFCTKLFAKLFLQAQCSAGNSKVAIK